MQYSFRLAELIGHVPDPKRRPGTIKAIVEYTGLDRHQVAALLKNEVKYVPMHALSRLCDYLIDHGFASPEQLPGALFAIEPEHFWELLARRKRLELCLGVRRVDPANWPDRAWVVASDSLLLGELLNGVSTLGGTAHYQGVQYQGEGGNRPPHPKLLRQSLVWSPGQAGVEQVEARAREVYEAFESTAGDRALVGLGSTKSNPVVELILARTFNCDPFVSQDSVLEPSERGCPFFLRYRDDDPHPSSCCAGRRLARNDPGSKPGLYYETAKGVWNHCSWQEPEHDTAFVFYVHRESQGRLEMALGGFSGRATRLLARTLAGQAQRFWPPVYDRHGLQIGLFIVRFDFNTNQEDPPPEGPRDLLVTDPVARIEVIPLDPGVIARRLGSN